MQALLRYWGTDYDWRKGEARLNGFPMFITEIDGRHSFHSRALSARERDADDHDARLAGPIFELLKAIGR